MTKTLESFKTKLLGKEFTTNTCGKCVVIDYHNCQEVTVMFYDPVYITKCEYGNLRKGNVKNRIYPSYYGKGYMGVGKYSSKDRKIYDLWAKMLERCYNEKVRDKQPTYLVVTVCDEWLNFQNFAAWCEAQDFFNAKDDKGRPYQLDKDILIKGNRVYSPETCCFVPKDINLLLLTSKKARGDYPIGVSYLKTGRVFRADLSINGKLKYLGAFRSPEEAFQAYKRAKESYVKDVANKWKDRIDLRTYQALLHYEVNADD